MIGRRSEMTGLILGLVILSAANAAVAFRQYWAKLPRMPDPSAAAWSTLAAGQRESLIEAYRGLSRRSDGPTLLRRGRDFARLPSARQEVLRTLHEHARRVLAEAAPARRREMLLADPGARAYFIHERLRAGPPEEYAGLRARVRAAQR